MLPPLEQELVCDGLEPRRDGHTPSLAGLLQQLPQLLCSHVAMAHDLVGVGSHCDIALQEQDVVYLMLTPCSVRLGLVVDAGEVREGIRGHLRRDGCTQCSVFSELHCVGTCSVGIPNSCSSFLCAALRTPSSPPRSVSRYRGWLQHVFVNISGNVIFSFERCCSRSLESVIGRSDEGDSAVTVLGVAHVPAAGVEEEDAERSVQQAGRDVRVQVASLLGASPHLMVIAVHHDTLLRQQLHLTIDSVYIIYDLLNTGICHPPHFLYMYMQLVKSHLRTVQVGYVRLSAHVYSFLLLSDSSTPQMSG